MGKLSMYDYFLAANGNRLRKLTKAFHVVLLYIDRIYFPEEYELEKRAKDYTKIKSSGSIRIPD